MAEKASKRVRVTHVGNPIMVKASQSEFRAVVQTLTGRKRPASSQSSSSKGLNWNCDKTPQAKIPRYGNELAHYSSILGTSYPTHAHNNNNQVAVCLQNEAEDKKMYDNEMFDKLESIIDDTSFAESLPLLL